jgi:hypothetical protein
MLRASLVLGTALALVACDQTQKTCDRTTMPSPPAVAVQAAQPAIAPCAASVERTVAFTTAQAKDKLIVEALGPDCANPAMFARLFDAQGRLVYADMTSGKWLMNAEMFPQAGGTAKGATENLYDIGEPNSMNLPAWRAGTRAPSRGNYGAFEALVPQPAYERLRALNATTLIKRGGAESGTFYIYDPEAGEAVAVAKFAV